MRQFLLVFLAILLFAPAGVFAQGNVGVGEFIPHALELSDQNGQEQNLETLYGEKGTTLVFVRSVDWCPFCQRQLIDLSQRADEFAATGYPLVALSYDSIEKSSAFTEKQAIKFPILSDPESETIKAFGLLDEQYQPDSFAHGVPKPVVFAIGKDKIVKAKFFNEGYKDRPQIDEILEGIKKIGQF